MQEYQIELNDDEISTVQRLACEHAAVEICRIHFKRINPSATFLAGGKGSDLRVRGGDGTEMDIEVKGTEANGLAWMKLKVSSQHSHDRLTAGMPMYRVTGIGSRTVRLFVMKHGEDFELVAEPRWSVRPAKTK